MCSAPATGPPEEGPGEGWQPLANRVAGQARDFVDGVGALATGQPIDLVSVLGSAVVFSRLEFLCFRLIGRRCMLGIGHNFCNHRARRAGLWIE